MLHHGRRHLTRLQETDSKAAWIDALIHNPGLSAETISSHSHRSLAQCTVPGKLQTALDILRHGSLMPLSALYQCAHHLLPFVVSATCEHLHAKAVRSPALRTAVKQAVVVFLAACSAHKYVFFPTLISIWSARFMSFKLNVSQLHTHLSQRTPLSTAQICVA